MNFCQCMHVIVEFESHWQYEESLKIQRCLCRVSGKLHELIEPFVYPTKCHTSPNLKNTTETSVASGSARTPHLKLWYVLRDHRVKQAETSLLWASLSNTSVQFHLCFNPL